MALLDDVKMSLRISTTAYDAELTDLIESAKADLSIAGVNVPSTLTSVVNTAIKTYVKLRFGTPDAATYAYLKEAYDEQKAQLSTNSDYTTFINTVE